MPQSNRKSEGTLTSFTVDADASGMHEMPGITKLLNRKKLDNSNTSTNSTPPPFSLAPPPPPPSVRTLSIHLEPISSSTPESPPEISLQLEPVSEPVMTESPPSNSVEISLAEPTLVLPAGDVPKTRAIKSKKALSTRALQQWETTTVSESTDPLAQVIQALGHQGGSEFLFLTPTQETSSQFVASAFLSPTPLRRHPLWNGIVWNLEGFADLWNELQKTGKAEFVAPGTVTHAHSARNLLRASLGLNSKEIVTLFRVGTTQRLRGVLAVISTAPMTSIPEVLQKLQRSES